MISKNKQNSTILFLQFDWHLFFSVTSLIILARTSSAMLNRSGDNQYSCLLSNLMSKPYKAYTIKTTTIPNDFGKSEENQIKKTKKTNMQKFSIT